MNQTYLHKLEERQRANLLKDALRIVDRLGEIGDVKNEVDDVEDLIDKAKKLKQSKLWIL